VRRFSHENLALASAGSGYRGHSFHNQRQAGKESAQKKPAQEKARHEGGPVIK